MHIFIWSLFSHFLSLPLKKSVHAAMTVGFCMGARSFLISINDHTFFPPQGNASGCFATIVLDVLFWIFLLKLSWNEKQWLLERSLFYLVFLSFVSATRTPHFKYYFLGHFTLNNDECF